MEPTIALRCPLVISGTKRGREVYKTPKPITILREILVENFIFSFHMIVDGSTARQRSVSALVAEGGHDVSWYP